MRILTVLSFYYPHWTGLTAHAVSIAESLAARGHEVTVLTTRHNPLLPRVEIIKGVRTIRLQPMSQVSRGMITPAFPYAVARLIRQHDVVQIHTPLPESLLVALLCRVLRRPLLMTHHGDVVMPSGRLNRFVEASAFKLLYETGRLANTITSYSRDYTEHSRMLSGLRDKVECVYPPVEMAPADPAFTSGWRRELGLDGRRLIGFAGRWVQEKGFDDLLRALPLIRQQEPDAHLVYAGDPHVVYENFFERCQPLIQAQRDQITFLGLIRDPQRMAAFYGMCDLLALPSRTDMLALVQIEALLCGTPVVASDIPGARVVVRETGMGRLAPPGDPRGLATAIVDVLRNPQAYRPDRVKVQSIFDGERSLARYEALLEGMLRRPVIRWATAATSPPRVSKSFSD